MTKDNFDIMKLIENLTESEKIRLYGFILGLKQHREKDIDKVDEK